MDRGERRIRTERTIRHRVRTRVAESQRLYADEPTEDWRAPHLHRVRVGWENPMDVLRMAYQARHSQEALGVPRLLSNLRIQEPKARRTKPRMGDGSDLREQSDDRRRRSAGSDTHNTQTTQEHSPLVPWQGRSSSPDILAAGALSLRFARARLLRL